MATLYRLRDGSLEVRETWGGRLEVVTRCGGMETTAALDAYEARDLLLALIPRQLPVGPAER